MAFIQLPGLARLDKPFPATIPAWKANHSSLPAPSVDCIHIMKLVTILLLKTFQYLAVQNYSEKCFVVKQMQSFSTFEYACSCRDITAINKLAFFGAQLLGSRAEHKKFVYNFEPDICFTIRPTLDSSGKLVQKFRT